MADLKDLREKRGQLVHDARKILDTAEAEKRGLSADETAKYNEIFGKQEELRGQIEREESLANAERQAAETALRNKDDKIVAIAPATGKRSSPEYNAAFSRALQMGMRSLSGEETRALQADSDTAGGYLTTPQQFVDQLIKDMDNMTFIRQLATKYRVPTAASMGAPVLAADPADSDWTAEILTGSEDSTMSFGKRELHPHPLAKRLKVSNKLIRMVAGADVLVRGRLAYKFGISQEKAFLTGTGSNQPLGVFTASANGVTAGRDVSTGNTTTAVTVDGLLEAKYSLKGQYWMNSNWLFHRDVLKTVAKLKDGDGQYLWRESVRAGEPDTLLGRPVMMSEYAPSTMTTGLYVGMLADFSNYWIADALDMQIKVVSELYAETDQIGYLGRLECDGMPVVAESFARIKLA